MDCCSVTCTNCTLVFHGGLVRDANGDEGAAKRMKATPVEDTNKMDADAINKGPRDTVPSPVLHGGDESANTAMRRLTAMVRSEVLAGRDPNQAVYDLRISAPTTPE